MPDLVVARPQGSRLSQRLPAGLAVPHDAGGAKVLIVLVDPVDLDQANPRIGMASADLLPGQRLRDHRLDRRLILAHFCEPARRICAGQVFGVRARRGPLSFGGMSSFFDQVRACLAGERLPLDSGATKLLYYMLE